MAELIVDMPEHMIMAFKEMLDKNITEVTIQKNIIESIVNGTLLPKGHKRLIEANEDLYQQIRNWAGPDKAYEIFKNAPTIVPESINNKNTD